MSEKNLYNLDDLLEKFHNGKISQRQLIIACSKYLVSEVHERTTFLDQYHPDTLERLYYLINNIHDVVRCKYCGNKAIWTGRIGEGYKQICNSRECQSKQLSDLKKGKTTISNNRDESFIQIQKNVIDVDDNIIKKLIKYDKYVSLIDNPIILEYLDNRYNDSDSRLETVQRIKLGIEEKPKCPTCGKPVVWVGKQTKLYTRFCSNICRARNSEINDRVRESIKNTYKQKFDFNS